jgi:hypothetical protein
MSVIFLSAHIMRRIACFLWTLSSDGLDYQEGGIGCAGATHIPDKPKKRCGRDRRHGVKHGIGGAPLPRRSLMVGA